MKKNIYLMYAIGLLQGMVFYGPIATLYRQAQGVTVFQITLIESISLALCIALEVPWGVVADRIGYRKTMIFSAGVTKRTGILGSCLLFCGLSIGACLVLAWTRSGVASVGSILLLRLSNTLFQPFQAEMQNRQIQTDNRATALSVNAMLMDCVAVGSNLVFGALSEYSLTVAFVFGGVLSGAALALLLLWHRMALVK